MRYQQSYARRCALGLGTLAAVLACGGRRVTEVDTTIDDGAAAPIQTDRAAYPVDRRPGGVVDITVVVRYQNATRGPVYLPTCRSVHPPVLEKRIGSAWVTAYSPVVPLCLGPPVVVQPGQAYAYTYHVVAFPHGGNTYPQFEVDKVPGTYRAVWAVYATWTPSGSEPGLGQLLPLAGRVSNTFEFTQ